MSVLLNIAAFQAAWLACAFGAAQGVVWPGLLAVAAVVTLHLWRSGRPAAEGKLALASGAIGAIAETALMATGLAAYAAPAPVPWLPPLWLAGMWVAFATTLNVCFGWLERRPMAAALVGAVFGPAAYFAGSRIGALTFAEPLAASLVAVAVMWALAMPLLMWLAARLAPVTEH